MTSAASDQKRKQREIGQPRWAKIQSPRKRVKMAVGGARRGGTVVEYSGENKYYIFH